MTPSPIRQLIFIDPSVPDSAQLLQQLPAHSRAIQLTAEESQIDQISALLTQYQGLDSLHIVTHGSPGALHFSNASLSSETLNPHWDQLAGWAAALAEDADILLYGCETGKGERGDSFIALLGHVTGKNIQASSQMLGHPALGGSWTLDRFSQ